MIYTSLLHLTQLKRNQEMANIHSMLEPKIRVKLAGNITIKCYDALITREHFFYNARYLQQEDSAHLLDIYQCRGHN